MQRKRPGLMHRPRSGCRSSNSNDLRSPTRWSAAPRTKTLISSRAARSWKLFKINRTAHGTYSAEIDAAYDQVDDLGADASIELHFNAASPAATGTETLSSGSAKSLAMAGALQKAMLKYLQRPDRGLKVLGSSDRGGRSLHAARRRPFWLSRSSPRTPWTSSPPTGLVSGFAKMYLEGLIEFAGLQPEGTRGSAEVNPRNVFGTLKLETKDLTKEEFSPATTPCFRWRWRTSTRFRRSGPTGSSLCH